MCVALFCGVNVSATNGSWSVFDLMNDDSRVGEDREFEVSEEYHGHDGYWRSSVDERGKCVVFDGHGKVDELSDWSLS